MSDGPRSTGDRSGAKPSLDELKKELESAKVEADLKKAQLEKTQSELGMELELAKAEVERDLAVATKQGELLGKLFPKGEITAPEGKIEADEKFGYAAELVAYRVMNRLEVELAGRLNETNKLPEDAKVLIVDKLQYAVDDLPLIETRVQLELFKETIDQREQQNSALLNSHRSSQHGDTRLMSATLLTAIAAIPPLVGTFADVAGYFLPDYSIKGQDFDVKWEGLVATIAGRLRAKGMKVFVSNFYSLGDSAIIADFVQLQRRVVELRTSRDLMSSQVVKPSNEHMEGLSKEIQELESERQKLDKETQQETIARLEQQLQELRQTLESQREQLDEANVAIQASDAILAAFEGFSKAITDHKDGPSKLAQAALRSKVDAMGITHLLWLGNLSSGGEAVTIRRRVFPSNTSFMGGTAFAFILASKEGEVVAADTLVGMGVLDHHFSKSEKDKVRYISL